MTGLRKFLVHVVAGAVVVSLVAVVKVLRSGKAIGMEGALRLFGVCGMAGGLAGAAHFFSHPLIRKSWPAAYLYGIIVVAVYLSGVTVCLLATDRFFPAMADPKLNDILSSGWFFGALGVTGAIGGVYWGHTERADYLAEQRKGTEAA